MNQILSVEMPKKNSKKTYGSSNGPKKVSTKSVIVFFCVILLILGIMMVALGVISKLSNKDEKQNQGQGQIPVVEENKPRVDIIQNASEIDVEVNGENEISTIEYRWNDEQLNQETGNGSNSYSLNLQIPSGANTFYIKVTDIEGNTSEYSHEYNGPESSELNISLNFQDGTNKLQIICNEEKTISFISYHYDNEEEQQEVVNNTSAQIEIPTLQGEHDLTVKVQYEDGTSNQKTNKVYFPKVERVKLSEDGNSFVLKASDVRKITKVKINLNGQESEETVDNENFEKTLQLISGENRLILTVYNSDGVSTTTKTKYQKNN